MFGLFNREALVAAVADDAVLRLGKKTFYTMLGRCLEQDPTMTIGWDRKSFALSSAKIAAAAGHLPPPGEPQAVAVSLDEGLDEVLANVQPKDSRVCPKQYRKPPGPLDIFNTAVRAAAAARRRTVTVNGEVLELYLTPAAAGMSASEIEAEIIKAVLEAAGEKFGPGRLAGTGKPGAYTWEKAGAAKPAAGTATRGEVADAKTWPKPPLCPDPNAPAPPKPQSFDRLLGESRFLTVCGGAVHAWTGAGVPAAVAHDNYVVIGDGLFNASGVVHTECAKFVVVVPLNPRTPKPTSEWVRLTPGSLGAAESIVKSLGAN